MRSPISIHQCLTLFGSVVPTSGRTRETLETVEFRFGRRFGNTREYKRLESAREELDLISKRVARATAFNSVARKEQKPAGNFKYERDTRSSD